MELKATIDEPELLDNQSTDQVDRIRTLSVLKGWIVRGKLVVHVVFCLLPAKRHCVEEECGMRHTSIEFTFGCRCMKQVANREAFTLLLSQQAHSHRNYVNVSESLLYSSWQARADSNSKVSSLCQ